MDHHWHSTLSPGFSKGFYWGKVEKAGFLVSWSVNQGVFIRHLNSMGNIEADDAFPSQVANNNLMIWDKAT